MDDKISQFVGITGSDAGKAQFYLDAAKGDVQEAVAAYYEADSGEGDNAEEAPQVDPSYTGPRTLSGAPAPAMPEGWGAAASSSSSRSSAPRQGGIATLGSMQGTSARSNAAGGGAFRGGIGRINHGDDSDEEEGGPPNLFAGGERSGLSVQDPEAERRRRLAQALAAAGMGGEGGAGGDMVQNILRQAAQAGAPPSMLPQESSSSGPSAFGGRGRTINDEAQGEEEEEEEEDEDDDEDGTDLPVAVRHLTFWQDGFTIGDSDLYRYGVPENEAILNAIHNQRAPLSLLNVKPNQRVELAIEEKRSEKYSPRNAQSARSQRPAQAFAGSGNRLGSPVPASSSAATPAPAAPAASGSSGASAPEVDSSKPTTQLQLRLSDSSRLVRRFNHTHTIADVRRFINASHPESAARSYSLHASYPPKAITDDSQTLEQAGLINAVLIQKLQ